MTTRGLGKRRKSHASTNPETLGNRFRRTRGGSVAVLHPLGVRRENLGLSADASGCSCSYQVVAVHKVKKDGPSMPYTYRDVYFVTTSGDTEADVQACAVAFGHDMTSETQFTRCHAFPSLHSAQMQADNVATCELARSEQTPYMDAKKVQVVLQRVATCDIG